MIRFVIDETLPTINTLLRMHWRKRGVLLSKIQYAVYVALAQSNQLPQGRAPMARCRIRIRRFSRNEPDVDALKATAKLLLDVLQPLSKRHPKGLGLIADDSSACIAELHVEHVPKHMARTEVEIEQI